MERSELEVVEDDEDDGDSTEALDVGAERMVGLRGDDTGRTDVGESQEGDGPITTTVTNQTVVFRFNDNNGVFITNTNNIF